MYLKNVLLFAAVAAFCAPSFATEPTAPPTPIQPTVPTPPIGDTFHLGDPVIRGNGCPAGTAQAVMTEDGSTISIFFDQYVAQTGAARGEERDYKSCNIAVPVHVPQGLSVALLDLDYRGYFNIPVGGKGTLSREYFFAGQRGDRINPTVFTGDGEISVSDRLLAESLIWSRCGADVIVRANTSLLAERPMNGTQQALVVIDTVDVSSSLQLHLSWKTCG